MVHTKRTTETVQFSPSATFIHGPVGTGKSTVARLIDFCFGGRLEKTPAIQQEFISAELILELSKFACRFERAMTDNSALRVTWNDGHGDIGSVNAPFDDDGVRLLNADVYNLSDLIFYLCGVTPIKVRKRYRDPDSPLVRLSFRDLLWYCYLNQDHLDSSFFRLEDPFRGLKSRDAMRFFTGLHSDRLNQLEIDLVSTLDGQRSKREAVSHIRSLMARFQLGTELDLVDQTKKVQQELLEASARRDELDRTRSSETHAVDPLRMQLRQLTSEIADLEIALSDTDELIGQQESLRSELITAKIKATRTEQAGNILEGVDFGQCPKCGADISDIDGKSGVCRLCRNTPKSEEAVVSIGFEALRRDLNERIDELTDSIARRRATRERQQRSLSQANARKAALDRQLADELAKYDSAFVTSIRATDREVAMLQERLASLERLKELPEAVNRLEEEAGELQGQIDRLRSAVKEERARLQQADEHVQRIADRFLDILLYVGFPGVYNDDHVVLHPRNWRPMVVHGEQEWGFFDAGSGGKKTLFNVCYALAVHSVAAENNLPVPSFLIIDSPTKNISKDEDPKLVRALYDAIYQLASTLPIQFLLIDSDLVKPRIDLPEFSQRRMAGTSDAPSLISYYKGP
ncbi:MAG: hypothetical protein C4575_08545 [Desulforudis sp.]|jgi:hypothetical protein|nr:MAG: hypothetical protein C4575_08545 [Desulforudis sp.]